MSNKKKVDENPIEVETVDVETADVEVTEVVVDGEKKGILARLPWKPICMVGGALAGVGAAILLKKGFDRKRDEMYLDAMYDNDDDDTDEDDETDDTEDEEE